MEKRKVLITNGMYSDCMLICTDAPNESLENWCYEYNKNLEDGKNIYFDTLKKQYHVDIIFDSEIDGADLDDVDYDISFDLMDY